LLLTLWSRINQRQDTADTKENLRCRIQRWNEYREFSTTPMSAFPGLFPVFDSSASSGGVPSELNYSESADSVGQAESQTVSYSQ
jgi:hypothetical protein